MSKQKFHWTITTLTPLHIGNGERLREGFDFVEYENRLWIANQGSLFRMVLEEAKRDRDEDEAIIASEIAGMTIYEMMEKSWLRAEHFDLNKRIFLYSLEGGTSKKGKDGEVFTHIKDVKNRPYLPGSSIKGALRSFILRGLSDADARKPEFHSGNPKTAAALMEHRFFSAPMGDVRKFPNYDIWRAFRIEDANITDYLPNQHLKLAHTIVHKGLVKGEEGESAESESIPLDIEVVSGGVTLITHSQVDTWLFENEYARNTLGFNKGQTHWMTAGLIESINRESFIRLEKERRYCEFIKEKGGTIPVEAEQNINRLIDDIADLEPNEMILPVGKGTGWRSKTLGRVLQDKLTDEEFSEMVMTFELGKGMWKRGDSFPYTRVFASLGNQRDTLLGWLKIRMEAE